MWDTHKTDYQPNGTVCVVQATYIAFIAQHIQIAILLWHYPTGKTGWRHSRVWSYCSSLLPLCVGRFANHVMLLLTVENISSSFAPCDCIVPCFSSFVRWSMWKTYIQENAPQCNSMSVCTSHSWLSWFSDVSFVLSYQKVDVTVFSDDTVHSTLLVPKNLSVSVSTPLDYSNCF